MQVSVIIPTFNREKTIEMAIRSVANQTVKVEEIIVVDDRSTDLTSEIVKKLMKEYCILRLMTMKKHGGAQAARNMGIRNAKCEWIAFMDSDDEWLPEKVEIQTKLASKYPQYDVIFGSLYSKSGNAVKYRTHDYGVKNIYSFDEILNQEIGFPTLCVKKSLLYKIGLLDERVPSYQEIDTKIRLAEKGDFIGTNMPLLKYNVYKGNTISGDKRKQAEGFRYVFLKNMDSICNHSVCDVVELYYSGMIARSVNTGERFVYKTIMALYHLNSRCTYFNEFIKKIMKFEYLLRYERNLI